MESELVRVNVYFPKKLLADLEKYVPARRRSALIVEATEKELRAIKLRVALDTGRGAWSDADHPDLKTGEDIDRYVREMRANWRLPDQDEPDA